ncbi:putative nitroreductase [Moraxella macacae 0408225]|uniref:Putative NAD(P)H nitroreductase n=1 Tax=Moraxella macacae 0408225 TaxID=1230338 RepID=L2F6B6_9GAMM|nr:nitroreductase [Moraxella macacae]ELA08460.1 putative nitroreductase [Moraxella macacae 0408225]
MNSQQILTFIQSRRSVGRLLAPTPTPEQIKQAVATALTAPDHKQLKPFRFVVLEKQSLDNLGMALQNASIENGETNEIALEKAKLLPKRAPMIIACLTDYKEHPKVPKFEQLLSAGAGVQNLLLALQAQGFASVWRSGDLMNSQAVKNFFGISSENDVVAFVYVGTADVQLPPRKTINLDEFVQFK